MVVDIILIVVFIAVIGFGFAEGLWANAIRLVNVVTAALLATSYFEPVAGWIAALVPSYEYFADILAIWGLFALVLAVLNALTELVSRKNVRFPPVVDRIGSGLLVTWAAWVMVCFTLTTLHTAPLPRNSLFGSFRPEQRMFFGLAPDRQWLAFVHKMSQGALSAAPFDPESEFVIKYAHRRSALEAHVKQTGSLRTR